jgi:MbtH protein
MSNSNTEALYAVVCNDEGQYSIWPADTTIPTGWIKVGIHGPKGSCLQYISQAWSDMRPLSLIKQMDVVQSRPLPQ